MTSDKRVRCLDSSLATCHFTSLCTVWCLQAGQNFFSSSRSCCFFLFFVVE